MRIAFSSLGDIESSSWDAAKGPLIDDLLRLQSTINKTWDVAHHADGSQRGLTDGLALGVIVGTLAEQPTGLTPEEDGLLYFVTDYGHLVRWNGSLAVWKFGPGDPGNGFFADYAIAPQAAGWALCDGSVTNYLVVGAATLTVAGVTLPDLITTGVYRRGGAYTGTVLGAVASALTISGSLTTSSNGAHTHTISGTTANESTHTHAAGGLKLAALTTTLNLGPGGNVTFDGFVDNPISGTSAAGSAHAHGAGSLAADSNGAHTHTISPTGTVDTAGRPPTLVIAPYFRR